MLSSKPRICLFGRHSNRVVLAYESYKHRSASLFRYVSTPLVADFIIVGFALDLYDNIDEVLRLKSENPNVTFVVLSEEPLWDTVYTPRIQVKLQDNLFGLRDYPDIQYYRIDHDCSDVFRFNHIPYFLTTSPEYCARYITLLHRSCESLSGNGFISAGQGMLRNIFAAVEKRLDDNPESLDIDGQAQCLSRFRVDVLESLLAAGLDVKLVGKGWSSYQQSQPSKRQELPDWHLDKLTLLQAGYTFCFSCENTHNKWYVTEKIFDSLAMGSIPIYYASPDHAVSSVLNIRSFINLYQTSSISAIGPMLREVNLAEHQEKMVADINSLLKIFKQEDAFEHEINNRIGRIHNILAGLA